MSADQKVILGIFVIYLALNAIIGIVFSKRQGSKLQKPKRRHSSKNRHGDRGQAADGAYACRNGQTQYSAAQPDEAP